MITPQTSTGEDDLRLAGPLAAGEGHGAEHVEGTSFAEAKRHAVEQFERSYLAGMLERHDGNISRTADAVGMARQSLQQKLKELGLRAGERKG